MYISAGATNLTSCNEFMYVRQYLNNAYTYVVIQEIIFSKKKYVSSPFSNFIYTIKN